MKENYQIICLSEIWHENNGLFTDNFLNQYDKTDNIAARIMEDNIKWKNNGINGRTTGDQEGKYTYISHLGKSTVDHIWANEIACRKTSMICIDHSLDVSDHHSVELSLESTHPRKTLKIRFKNSKNVWNGSAIENYRLELNTQDDINDWHQLKKKIVQAAKNNNMYKEFWTSSHLTIQFHKKNRRLLNGTVGK